MKLTDDIITGKRNHKSHLGEYSKRQLQNIRTARIVNDFFRCNPDANPLEAATTLGYSIKTIYKYM